MKENYHNCRTSNNTDMKLGQVTKFNKSNTVTSRKTDDNVMSGNCDVTVIFPFHGQFRAIRKMNSGCMVCENLYFH